MLRAAQCCFVKSIHNSSDPAVGAVCGTNSQKSQALKGCQYKHTELYSFKIWPITFSCKSQFCQGGENAAFLSNPHNASTLHSYDIKFNVIGLCTLYRNTQWTWVGLWCSTHSVKLDTTKTIFCRVTLGTDLNLFQSSIHLPPTGRECNSHTMLQYFQYLCCSDNRLKAAVPKRFCLPTKRKMHPSVLMRWLHREGTTRVLKVTTRKSKDMETDPLSVQQLPSSMVTL